MHIETQLIKLCTNFACKKSPISFWVWYKDGCNNSLWASHNLSSSDVHSDDPDDTPYQVKKTHIKPYHTHNH